MTLAALFLALAFLLPFLTGQIPEIGAMLCPMHLPVFLAGLLLGPLWGGAVGLTAPLLRSVTLGMPPLFPVAVAMSLELLTYGAAAGLFYRYLPKKPLGLYVSLISAQFFGRLSWGIVQYLLSVFDKENPFYLEFVVAQTLSNSLPGIAIQLLLIPPVVYAMQRARFISKY